MDPDLISPILHRFLPRESFRYEGYAIRNARHADQGNCDESFKVKMTAFDLKVNSVLQLFQMGKELIDLFCFIGGFS